MPVPGFLASFADKAQSAINASPLAAHLPSSHPRPSSPDSAAQTPANEAAAQGGSRSHALESIQYQLRAFGQQYSTTTPAQKIITIEKGVAIDLDSVSRDSKSQSKELYTWGQGEADDIKDVTDRLAYLNFVHGSLAGSLSAKFNAARGPIKALRDAETAITPRRNIRAGIQLQINRLEHEQQKGMERKIAELKDQLRKLELEDQGQEREIEILKRKAVRESEQQKWEALREYGEKLVLLSQAAVPVIAALPSLPPTVDHPYTGAQATGAARASLQRALDNYKTGHINLPPQLGGADLGRSDTRSFGESHASELSSINYGMTSGSNLSSTPPSSTIPIPSPQKTQSPINPQALNLSPTHIPIASSQSPLIPPDPSVLARTVPANTPTIAETGVPVTAGATGPGPASGSLHDIKSASSQAGPRSGGFPTHESQPEVYGQASVTSSSPLKHESAEEEKRRLQANYGQAASGPLQVPAALPVAAQRYESTEEKKRLEREEREKTLREGTSHQSSAPAKKDDDLPPYQDM